MRKFTRGLGLRGRVLLAGVMATAGLGLSYVMGSGMAYAACATPDPNDPTDCAAEAVLNSSTTWITDHGIVLVVGLLVVGIIVGLLIKYSRKARSAAA